MVSALLRIALGTLGFAPEMTAWPRVLYQEKREKDFDESPYGNAIGVLCDVPISEVSRIVSVDRMSAVSVAG